MVDGEKKKMAPASSSSSLLQPSIAASQLATPNKVPTKAPLQQRTFQTPVRKPKAVDMPQLARMQTRLPVPNLMERIWLYESLIRFDLLQIPNSILMNLDKFDDWTETQVQVLLEKLICRIAEISSVKAKPLRLIHKKLVESFLATGNDLKRGEAWDAAKKFCLSNEARLVNLEMVELLPHQKGGARKAAFQSQPASNETLLGGRLTRSRRLAETRALERVKAISRREMESSDESELSEESEQNSQDEASSEEGTDDDEAPRGHQWSKKGAVRRSARRKAINTKTSSSSEGDTSIEDEKKGEGHGSDESVAEILEEDEPIMMPTFEERIAILSALVDVVVQTKQINEETTLGFKTALELEKSGREEEKELLHEQEEEMRLLNDKAPSMTLIEEYQQWKEEKRELTKKHDYEILDLRVHTQLQIEANKIRSEPLGVDVDGNQYWQLSEYVEVKPQDSTGRWAWNLLVLGTPFFVASKEEEPPVPLESTEAENIAAKSSSVKNEEVKDESVDSEVMVVISVPLKKKSASATEEEEERAVSGNTPSLETKVELPSVPLAQGKTNEPPTGFTSTDKYEIIGQLIEYIHYRLSLREYEELLQYRKKNEVKANPSIVDLTETDVESSNQTLSAEASSSSTSIPSETEVTFLQQVPSGLTDGKREKKELRDSHTVRRKEVEELVKRLDMVRQYYKWHSEDSNQED